MKGVRECMRCAPATSSSPQQARTANGASPLVTRCPCASLACKLPISCRSHDMLPKRLSMVLLKQYTARQSPQVKLTKGNLG